VAAFSGVIHAQSREISEKEFNQINAAASKVSYERQYRSTMKSRHFEKGEGTPSMEISALFERVGPDKWRSLRIEKDLRGTRETEIVTIDRFVYSRSAGTPWVKKTVEESSRGTGMFSAFGEVPALEAKSSFSSLGTELANDQHLKVFESRIYRKYELGSGRYLAYTSVDRLWIDAEGRFAKRTSQNFEADDRLTIETIWTYEYPAEVQIRAPIK
jgi:hypothetical protein